jgi:glycerol uptake facilitator-like aquaporin
LLQNLQRIVCSLTSNQRKFVAEIIGTFIVVVLATGSVVIDAKTNGILGIPFIAFAPFIGVAIAVYLFGKISMAHFNPAVSVGFLITILLNCRDNWCFACKPICKICNRN